MKHNLLEDQVTWLKNNYRLYSNYHLSVKLGVKQYVVEYWLRKFDLRKRKSKISPLTEDQKAYIKDNYQRSTAEKMAIELGIAVCRVRSYVKKNKLYKWRKPDASPTPPKHIIPYNKPEKTFTRPPATYSAGQEATIDKYLNLDI